MPVSPSEAQDALRDISATAQPWANATRLVLIGIAIALLTLIGFFWMPQIFLLWMAFVGSGALIFAGLWLRTA